jgi:hypothetical protein
MRKLFQPGRDVSVAKDMNNNPVVLPTQFIAATAIGFREVVAGLLWVRTDSFFHEGKFEAMVPLFRIITWLDPHQIDVYSTGSWHMAYNFTDSRERADHRYLPTAIDFLNEGIRNNPDVWDLKQAMGFTIHFERTLDFNEAVRWMTLATHDPGCRSYMGHLIAHSYERAGRIDKAVQQWHKSLAEADAAYKRAPKDFQAWNNFSVCQKNLNELLARIKRRTDVAKHPVNLGFEAYFTHLKPRMFIINGRINCADGSKVDVYLEDLNRPKQKLDPSTLGLDLDATEMYQIGIHGLAVRKGKFSEIYDLSKDQKQYPFKSDKYRLVVRFNPRIALPEVQDKTGWSGEGLANQPYLDTKSVKGLRQLQKVIILNRKDLI